MLEDGRGSAPRGPYCRWVSTNIISTSTQSLVVIGPILRSIQVEAQKCLLFGLNVLVRTSTFTAGFPYEIRENPENR